MDYPIAENEAERLLALEQLGQLDSPAEERFDRLTRLVRDHFDVPYSMVTMLDRDRQWIKSCQGASVSESPREMSFCNYAIMQEELFTIPDMKKGPSIRRAPSGGGSGAGPVLCGDSDPHTLWSSSGDALYSRR